MEESRLQLLKIKMSGVLVVLLWLANIGIAWGHINGYEDQPLSKIAIHKATLALRDSATLRARPSTIGKKVYITLF